MPFYDNTDPLSWASRMRSRRVLHFADWLTQIGLSSPHISIIDIGGTVEYWQQHLQTLIHRGLDPEITVVNSAPLKGREIHDDRVKSIQGDGRNLYMIGDRSFDVAYSNSVIEHVGTFGDQVVFAQEVARVAKYYYVQTPYKYFVVEPHFVVPLWFLIPLPIRCLLLSHFDLGWYTAQKNFYLAKMEIEQVRLMSVGEVRHTFPGCRIRRERCFGLTKSLTVMRASY